MSIVLALLIGWGTTEGAAAEEARAGYWPAAKLGMAASVRLSGTMAEQHLAVPVHPGLSPGVLRFKLESGIGVTHGMLDISAAGRPLLRVRLPAAERVIEVDLTGLEPREHFLALRIRTVLNPEADIPCSATQILWMELRELAVQFVDEARPPTTIASFWPPHLEELRIFLPPEPAAAETDAALVLAAFATRLAGGQPVTVTVAALHPGVPWPAPPPGPFSRGVVVRASEAEDVWLLHRSPGTWPLLVVSAPADRMRRVAETVVGMAKPLLLAEAATVRPGREALPPGHRLWTFERLGHPQIQMQGAGQMETSITFTHADLGGAVDTAVLRLAGRHSPVPEGGHAQLTVLLNGGLVDAVPLKQGSRFELEAGLPAALLRRDNTLAVRVVYTPPGGECRVGVHDIMVHLDGSSHLEVMYGSSLPPGFERFPQCLLPTFQVAFDEPTVEAVDAAAHIVAGLQRLTRTTLRPVAVPWDDALDSELPLVALASVPAHAAALAAPLEPAAFRLIDRDGEELLQLDIDAQFAVLQAFEADGRDVLLATHKDWPRGVQRAARRVSAGDGWYALTGDVWLMPSREPPFSVRLRDSGLRAVPMRPDAAPWLNRMRLPLFIAALVVAAGFLIWAYPRVVRAEPGA